MGGSGSKVTCDSKIIKIAFKGLSCTKAQVENGVLQIANDLYKYFHLADTRWEGVYPLNAKAADRKSCGEGNDYSPNPDYDKDLEALEQALLTKLTNFFNNRTKESVRNMWKPKLYKIIENITKDLTSSPALPQFCKKKGATEFTQTGRRNYTRYNTLVDRDVSMFHIEDKINFVTKIIDGMFPSLAGEIEEPLDKVQPTIKF